MQEAPSFYKGIDISDKTLPKLEGKIPKRIEEKLSVKDKAQLRAIDRSLGVRTSCNQAFRY